MAYKLKSKAGRKKSTYKERGIKGFTPKGFVPVKYSRKKKAFIFKRDDGI